MEAEPDRRLRAARATAGTASTSGSRACSNASPPTTPTRPSWPCATPGSSGVAARPARHASPGHRGPPAADQHRSHRPGSTTRCVDRWTLHSFNETEPPPGHAARRPRPRVEGGDDRHDRSSRSSPPEPPPTGTSSTSGCPTSSPAPAATTPSWPTSSPTACSWWTGPVQLPIDELNRLAGPPGDPVLVVVDDDEWRDDVEELGDKVEEGWEPPPMVVTYRDGQLRARGRQPPGRGPPAGRRDRRLGRRRLRDGGGAGPVRGPLEHAPTDAGIPVLTHDCPWRERV